MQISIEVISVGQVQTIPTKNGKSYQCIEIAYKKDGKIEGKKIMSFVNPAVFKSVQNLSQGDSVTISTEKGEPNAQGQSFWQWTAVGDVGAAPQQTTAASSGGGTTQKTTSTYETSEERAKKQVYIVRQSSINAAIAAGNKKVPDILSVAKDFENYVFDTQPVTACATKKEVKEPSIYDLEGDEDLVL